MKLFGDVYRGRRVLVTGHTGFKGSWLAAWLQELGAAVTGLALDPDTTPNHWDVLSLDVADHRLDIRDASSVAAVVRDAAPEVVFHLAAQPLVRRSYRDPLRTWSTNVMGTANLLNACRDTPSVRAIVVVTTDKSYKNREWARGYREDDELGGHDPYSASKAAAELVAASYRSAFFHQPGAPQLATARAGNVVGGGDWSEDRLIPDLIRSIAIDESLEIRSPDATRPWQHVLESLSGYLLLGQLLLAGESSFADAWNFGPEPSGNRTVATVLELLQREWPEMRWHVTREAQVHEARLLYLDITKAKTRLAWQPVWSLEQTLSATARWYRDFSRTGDAPTRAQIGEYVASARVAQAPWIEA
jgi:CDP-glucose 4,6-dehydratase